MADRKSHPSRHKWLFKSCLFGLTSQKECFTAGENLKLKREKEKSFRQNFWKYFYVSLVKNKKQFAPFPLSLSVSLSINIRWLRPQTRPLSLSITCSLKIQKPYEAIDVSLIQAYSKTHKTSGLQISEFQFYAFWKPNSKISMPYPSPPLLFSDSVKN